MNRIVRSGIVLHELQTVYWQVQKVAHTALKTFLAGRLNLQYKGSAHDAPFEYTQTVIPNYFNFAIVRHPLARLYSCYSDIFTSTQIIKEELNKNREEVSFSDFVHHVITVPKEDANAHYACQDSLVPEGVKIYKFEEQCNLLRLFIPVKNASTNGEGWEQAYDENTKKLCSRYYEKSLSRFGYNLP